MNNLPLELTRYIYSYLSCGDIATGISLCTKSQEKIWNKRERVKHIGNLHKEYVKFRGRCSLYTNDLLLLMLVLTKSVIYKSPTYGPYELGRAFRKCNELLLLKLW